MCFVQKRCLPVLLEHLRHPAHRARRIDARDRLVARFVDNLRGRAFVIASRARLRLSRRDSLDAWAERPVSGVAHRSGRDSRLVCDHEEKSNEACSTKTYDE